MKNPEQAVTYFQSGFNCAQAVFVTYAEQLGLNREMAIKIARGFGAGMGKLQETCGALTGAFMAIGLGNKNDGVEENELKENTYKLIQEFTKIFMEKHNSTLCKELINCDLRTEEGKAYFKDKQLSENVCVDCVRDAAGILDEIFNR